MKKLLLLLLLAASATAQAAITEIQVQFVLFDRGGPPPRYNVLPLGHIEPDGSVALIDAPRLSLGETDHFDGFDLTFTGPTLDVVLTREYFGGCFGSCAYFVAFRPDVGVSTRYANLDANGVLGFRGLSKFPDPYQPGEIVKVDLDLTAPIPEPQTWVLLTAGVLVAGAIVRRRQAQS